MDPLDTLDSNYLLAKSQPALVINKRDLHAYNAVQMQRIVSGHPKDIEPNTDISPLDQIQAISQENLEHLFEETKSQARVAIEELGTKIVEQVIERANEECDRSKLPLTHDPFHEEAEWRDPYGETLLEIMGDRMLKAPSILLPDDTRAKMDTLVNCTLGRPKIGEYFLAKSIPEETLKKSLTYLDLRGIPHVFGGNHFETAWWLRTINEALHMIVIERDKCADPVQLANAVRSAARLEPRDSFFNSPNQSAIFIPYKFDLAGHYLVDTEGRESEIPTRLAPPKPGVLDPDQFKGKKKPRNRGED